MTETVELLKSQLRALSAAERAELANFLRTSVGPDEQSEIRPLHGMTSGTDVKIVVGADKSSETLPIHAERPPLRVEEGGVVRVGKSRIALDLLVREYENGMTPEDMVRAYDTLELADVYAALAYYLRHRAEVKAYLDCREEEAARLRTLIESQAPLRPTKAELLARRRQKDLLPS
jgi:uncharacterized protein (DUF433 family)